MVESFNFGQEFGEIRIVANRMTEAARSSESRVDFVFNGIEIFCEKNENAAKVIERYNEGLAIKSKFK